MIVSVVKTNEEIEKCFEVMIFLRPHLVRETFVEKVHRQFAEGYHMACIFKDARAVSVVGYRCFETMAWGKILYIDDLITHPDNKKSGYATHLLDWIFNQAKEKQCDQVHLDSGYQRNTAHRLYLNKGFDITSHHFSKNAE